MAGEAIYQTIGDVAQGRRTDAEKKAKEAREGGNEALAQEYDQEAKNWGDGGVYKIALHAAGGLILGDGVGAVSAGVNEALLPKMVEMIAAQLPIPEGASPEEVAAIQEKRDNLLTLASTVVGVAAGGATGANIAQTATVNNYLKHDEEVLLRQAQEGCDKGNKAACKERDRLDALDKQRDQEVDQFLLTCESRNTKTSCAEIAEHYAEVNGYGLASQMEESERKSGTPFSYNECPSSDKGGCSYGPFQLAGTGGMAEFFKYLEKNPSEESQAFLKELNAVGGMKSALDKNDPKHKDFVDKWMELTKNDPQFIEYQFESINRGSNMNLVRKELTERDIDFNDLDRTEKEAVFSTAVQQGGKGTDNALEYAFSEKTYTQNENDFNAKEMEYEDGIKERNDLIKESEGLIKEKSDLQAEKIRLLERKEGASESELKDLNGKIFNLDGRIQAQDKKVQAQDVKVQAKEAEVKELGDWLNNQAQVGVKDSEQFIKDIYEWRIKVNPKETERYMRERDMLLEMQKEEQKKKDLSQPNQTP